MNPSFRILLTRELGYHPKWLEYGYLSDSFLQNQIERLRQGEDPHLEHYRYVAFQAILDNAQTLSDVEIARYIELAQLDADRSMGQGALSLLLRWYGLTDEQFQNLVNHPALAVDWVQKLAVRRNLIRIVHTRPFTDAMFEHCLTLGDSQIHRLLLNTIDLTQQIEILAARAANRAVRNIAKQRLRR
jgi:hypothetical protein